MDEPGTATPREPDELKEWVTPELIVEDVKDVTLGGTGDEPILATEEEIGTYYHS
jgi:hypothetical protein